MKNIKKILINSLNKMCTKKVSICTTKFCATGCLVEDYDDEDIVCLENVEMTFTSGYSDVEHRASLCICANHIIAFEVIE